MLLLPLLVLSLAALLPVDARLKCYDCLSKAVPDCGDNSNTKSLDQVECPRDENFCSVLIMKDTNGKRIVSRQCASSPNESQQLKNYVRAAHDADLTVEKFDVCNTDLCNVLASPKTGSGVLPSAASSVGLLSLALGALTALRPTV